MRLLSLLLLICLPAHADVQNFTLFNGQYMFGFSSGSILFSNGTQLVQNNPMLYWDNTNFRLGIGTNAPTSQVTVTNGAASTTTITINNTNTTSSNNSSFLMTNDASASGSFSLFGNAFTATYLQNNARLSASKSLWLVSDVNSATGGTDPIILSAGGYNSEDMRVTATGVGIGQTNPSYSLDVTGTVRATTSITDNGIATSSAGAPLSINSSQVLIAGITNSEVSSSSALAISTTLGVIGGSTSTPAAGTYLVNFSCYASASSAGGNVLTAELYVGGTAQADTVRKITPLSSAALATFQDMALALNKIVTVNGSQAIAVEAQTSAGTVTVSGLDFDLVRLQ